jgi:phosphomethylpyrimidine synthase
MSLPPNWDTTQLDAADHMIATKESFEPHSSEQLPNSKKVYVAGKIHPDVRVPMREIEVSPTKSYTGASSE